MNLLHLLANISNMNKRLILIAVLNFLAPFTYGQYFYDSLKIEADRTYNSSFVDIDVDSINKVFFDSKNVRMLFDFDSTATYQVLFSDRNGFSYQGGVGISCPCNYEEYLAEESIKHLLDSNYRRTRNLKRHYDLSKTYKGDEFIRIGLSFKDSIFTSFPLIRNNGDEYNARWTVFSNEKYLIFRFVSLYWGNRYSYDETLIYLKKIE